MAGAPVITQLDRANRWIVKHKLALPDTQQAVEGLIFDILRERLNTFIERSPRFRELQGADRDDLAQEALFLILLALRRCNFYFASSRILNLYLRYALGRVAPPRWLALGDLLEDAPGAQIADNQLAHQLGYTQDDVERVKRQVFDLLSNQRTLLLIFQGLCEGRPLTTVARELAQPFGSVYRLWSGTRRALRRLEPNPFLLDHAILDLAEEHGSLARQPAPAGPTQGAEPANAPAPHARPLEQVLAKAELLKQVLQRASDRPLMQAVALCLAACLSPDKKGSRQLDAERFLEFGPQSELSYQAVINELARIIGHALRKHRESTAEQGA